MTGMLPGNQFSEEQKSRKSKQKKKRRLYFAQEREQGVLYNETPQVGHSEYSTSFLDFTIRSSSKI